MAKRCEVCNKEYAEDLSACPHCAAAGGHKPSDSERVGKTTHLAGKPGTPTMLASGEEQDPTRTAVPRSTKVTQLAGHSPSPTMTAKELEKELSEHAEDAAAEALLEDEPG